MVLVPTGKYNTPLQDGKHMVASISVFGQV
jgi:hypothetical protein